METKRLMHTRRILILPVFIFVSALLNFAWADFGTAAGPEVSGKLTRTDGNSLSAEEKLRAQQSYGRLPLYFVENRGQAGERVKFYEKEHGRAVYFTLDGITFANDSGDQAVLTPVGMRESVDIVAAEPLKGRVNYLKGNDPGRWTQDVPTFGSLTYKDVYPGVDLRFYGDHSQMEYDIIVRPGADPSQVKMEYTGVEGLSVNEEGDLLVKLAGGDTITQKRPVIYQESGEEKIPVDGSFEILQNDGGRFSYGFRLASHDPDRTLVIDPAISYSSYLGGTFGELIYAMAADASGNVYVTGFTLSADYPVTPNAYSTALSGDHDCFVTKIDASGAMAYSTYLGGSDYDTAFAIAVDDSGNIYLGGATGSDDFPITQNGTPHIHSSGWNGFVTKINASGALVYSTCIGGSNGDEVHAVAVDASGNAYVGGITFSADFPLKNPVSGQEALHSGACSTYNDCNDGFVAKLDPSGVLAFSTYFGGDGDEQVTSMAVDAAGNIYAAGLTNSSDFPTLNPIPGQAALHSGDCGARACDDGFITKISPSGVLAYSSYLGATGEDYIASIAVDASGNLYAAGNISGADFPTTPGAYSTNSAVKGFGFVSKVSADGSSLVYSTCFGGSVGELITGLAVDASGNVTVAGNTYSPDFPTTSDALLEPPGLYSAGFITKFNASGSALLYSTYLGWNENFDDMFTAMATDPSGNIYVSGYTYSSYFPVTPNATWPTHGPDQIGTLHQAGFIMRISPDADLSISQTASAPTVPAGGTLSFTIQVSNAGPEGASGVQVSDSLPTGLSLVSALSSQGTCSQSSGTTACNLGKLAKGASATVTITTTALQTGNISNTAGISANEFDPDTSNNSATASATVIQPTGSLTVSIGPSTAASAGALWNVDGGGWQTSGTKVSGIALGQHVVGFKDISGWVKSSGQTVQTTSGQTTSLSVQYQQLPAVSSLQIAAGAANTTSRNVTLNNTATVNPTFYMACESADFSGAAWLTYSTAPIFTLSAGGGVKTVYFKVKNSAGESVAVSSTIQLVAPPAVATLLIDNGAPTTPSRTVTLDNTATEPPTYYMASESSTFLGATWKPYSANPTFALSAANGKRTVYFKVKNATSVSPVKSASIVLAQLPTVTSFKINGGAASTITQTVRLNNTATISPTQFMASESSTFDGASWKTYSAVPTFTLSSGRGVKRVYFKVKNGVGESLPVSASIQLTR